MAEKVTKGPPPPIRVDRPARAPLSADGAVPGVMPGAARAVPAGPSLTAVPIGSIIGLDVTDQAQVDAVLGEAMRPALEEMGRIEARAISQANDFAVQTLLAGGGMDGAVERAEELKQAFGASQESYACQADGLCLVVNRLGNSHVAGLIAAKKQEHAGKAHVLAVLNDETNFGDALSAVQVRLEDALGGYGVAQKQLISVLIAEQSKAPNVRDEAAVSNVDIDGPAQVVRETFLAVLTGAVTVIDGVIRQAEHVEAVRLARLAREAREERERLEWEERKRLETAKAVNHSVKVLDGAVDEQLSALIATTGVDMCLERDPADILDAEGGVAVEGLVRTADYATFVEAFMAALLHKLGLSVSMGTKALKGDVREEGGRFVEEERMRRDGMGIFAELPPYGCEPGALDSLRNVEASLEIYYKERNLARAAGVRISDTRVALRGQAKEIFKGLMARKMLGGAVSFAGDFEGIPVSAEELKDLADEVIAKYLGVPGLGAPAVATVAGEPTTLPPAAEGDEGDRWLGENLGEPVAAGVSDEPVPSIGSLPAAPAGEPDTEEMPATAVAATEVPVKVKKNGRAMGCLRAFGWVALTGVGLIAATATAWWVLRDQRDGKGDDKGSEEVIGIPTPLPKVADDGREGTEVSEDVERLVKGFSRAIPSVDESMPPEARQLIALEESKGLDVDAVVMFPCSAGLAEGDPLEMGSQIAWDADGTLINVTWVGMPEGCDLGLALGGGEEGACSDLALGGYDEDISWNILEGVCRGAEEPGVFMTTAAAAE